MKKYDSIDRIGQTSNNGILTSPDKHLFVQEKLDGANFRFTLQRNIEEEYHEEGRDIVFGSRNVEYKHERDTDKTFQHAVEYVRENANVDAMLKLDDQYGPLTFFGEAMHSHTLDYDWENTPSFLGFDVYSERHEEYARPDEMERYFERIGLPTVPTLSLSPLIGEEIEIPDSVYRDGKAEGVVIKNTQTNQIAKVRSEAFKEVHKSPKGKTPEDYEPEDAKNLAYKFATEARILKEIHKAKDRGETIEMAMMDTLWRDVFEDIIEEEYETIFLGNHTIDTKAFRSEVAGITAQVLEQYLARPDDSVLNEAPA